MEDLTKLPVLAKLIDDIDALTSKLEEAYSKNDAELFTNTKNKIIEIQNKISEVLQ